MLTASDLDVLTLGTGPRVVFVHGSIVGAERTWRRQLELADRFTLVLPNRPGFADSPPLERGDFELEAPLIAELLGDGAHLVGHSYGAVISLLAAAQRPEAVRSLTVSEPGSLNVAQGNPHADATRAQGDRLYRLRHEMPPKRFVEFFRSGVHSDHETPDELPEWLERGARHAMHERAPWEAEIPLDVLERAPFPKLVISGDHSPAFEAVCDVIADATGARREVLAGRGHTIPGMGEPYNGLVSGFLTDADRSA